ncbi:MAG: hypothetical protein FWF82_05285 [Oscillospiraceae bacterium]|nr:hypothetical protein [Oscillospiraceae bacterium]
MKKFGSVLAKFFLVITYIAIGFTFFVFVLLPFYGIKGENRWSTDGVYGWAAIYPYGLAVMSVIFLAPSLIYQTVYFLVKRRGDSAIMRKAVVSAVIIAVSAVATLALVVVADNRATNRQEEILSEAREAVMPYLRDVFGEDAAAEMELVSSEINRDIFCKVGENAPFVNFGIKSPLVNGRTFGVKYDVIDGNIEDFFEGTFLYEYNIRSKLEEMFAESLKTPLPENVKVSVGSDIKNFYEVYDPSLSMEELLDLFKVDYSVSSFDIRLDEYNEDAVVETIKQIYSEYYDYMNNRSYFKYSFCNFYVNLSVGTPDYPYYRTFANGSFSRPNGEKNKVEIRFYENSLYDEENTVKGSSEIYEISESEESQNEENH